MNIKVIDSAHDLESAVGQILAGWDTPSIRITRDPSREWDFIAYADVDGKHHRFGVDCKLRPSVKDVEKLAARNGNEVAPLLITVQATGSLVEHCKQLGVSCLDLNGRAWLRAKGLLIDRDSKPGNTVQYRSAEPPANLFSLKGSRLARALLSFPGRQWRQVDLAAFTGLSQGLLSRLLSYASEEGWVTGIRGDWSIKDQDGLLDAWRAADVWKKRATVRQFSALEGDPAKLAKRVLDHATGEIAFTQWFGAKLRFPYADVPIVSAYVAEPPTSELTEAIGVREVASGGKLWLISPKDAGVFQATRRIEQFPVVCDVQLYLDLLQVGLRGPDQAEALRTWEGFCKR